jgi:hypothetical protein
LITDAKISSGLIPGKGPREEMFIAVIGVKVSVLSFCNQSVVKVEEYAVTSQDEMERIKQWLVRTMRTCPGI